MHARSELRHTAAEARNPLRLQACPSENLRSGCLCQASPTPGAPARQIQPKSSGARERFQKQTWRARGCPSGCIQAVGSTRHLQANDHSMCIDKSTMGTDYRLLTALYLHLGPFSRHVIRQIEQQLDRSEDISSH